MRGYRCRILDGNHLSKTERRIKELRATWAAAMPGKVLAVYEPATDLVTHVCLTPDGHAQERELFDDVLALVQRRNLWWIADRNFCTLKLLFGIDAQGAAFAIRQHAGLPVRLLGKRRYRGRAATGLVYEQAMELEYEGQTLRVRRVTVVLDVPTTDGDTEIHVVTNLSEKKADALAVAELYRKRWTIEGRFYEVTQTLNCEPNTLGYPKAALFAFLALVASNAVALLRASLRAVHDVGGGRGDVPLLCGTGSARDLRGHDDRVAAGALGGLWQIGCSGLGGGSAGSSPVRSAYEIPQSTVRGPKTPAAQRKVQEWGACVDAQASPEPT